MSVNLVFLPGYDARMKRTEQKLVSKFGIPNAAKKAVEKVEIKDYTDSVLSSRSTERQLCRK